MNIKSLLAGVALAALSTSAFATTLTLTDPPGQTNIPYNVVFQATSAVSTVYVNGYQIPSYEYLTFNSVTDLTTGSTTNLLNPTWVAVTSVFGAQYSDGSGVNALQIGSVQPANPDKFWNSFATVAGDSYLYQFKFSNSFAAPTPSQLVVTFTAGVPETSTWVMMLAGFAGLGFAGYRRRALAA